MKFLFPLLIFVLVWFIVAFFVGAMMTILFGPSGLILRSGGMSLSIGFYADWRTWPGNLLGMVLGMVSALETLDDNFDWSAPLPPRRSTPDGDDDCEQDCEDADDGDGVGGDSGD